MHGLIDMRVATRPSSPNAGSGPVLRVFHHLATIHSMPQSPIIDVPALKKAIIESTGPGKRFTRRALSLKATENRNPDLVRDILSRGQDKKVTVETATGLALAMDKSPADFIRTPTANVGPETIQVVGAVEAGVWREQAQWPEEKRYEVEVAPSPISGERFGLLVIGDSMNRTFPHGTVLDCFRVPFSTDPHLQPQPGDIVVVERAQGELVETTCKRLNRDGNGDWYLTAESWDPQFSDPIPMGQPTEHGPDDEIRVVGIVNAAIQQHLKRRSA